MRRQLAILSVILTAACGAPTKSAGDVASLFSGSGLSLQDKETALCSALAARTTPPTTSGMSINLAGCQNAGLTALNYKSISQFVFLGLDGSKPNIGTTSQVQGTGQNAIIHTQLRTQVWLNKTLIDLAQSLGGVLNAPGSTGAGSVISLPDSSGGSFAGLVTPTITLLQAPTIDTKNYAFSMKINIKLAGAVKADHDIQISGQLVNNAIAVTVATTADRTFDQSILKNFQAVIMLIPHAQDMYLDLFVDVNINDFGLETLVQDQVTSFLSTGLKGFIDKAAQL